jgi:DUF971 family protein
MEIRSAHIVGSELAVVWGDGHESYYSIEELRRECPCAFCAGESDLFGRVSRPQKQTYSERSFELSSVEQVGNYGLQLHFSDGHQWGIWTVERLMEFCRCGRCMKEGVK